MVQAKHDVKVRYKRGTSLNRVWMHGNATLAGPRKSRTPSRQDRKAATDKINIIALQHVVKDIPTLEPTQGQGFVGSPNLWLVHQALHTVLSKEARGEQEKRGATGENMIMRRSTWLGWTSKYNFSIRLVKTSRGQ